MTCLYVFLEYEKFEIYEIETKNCSICSKVSSTN